MIEVRMGGSNGRSQERQEAGTSGGGVVCAQERARIHFGGKIP